MLGSGLPISVVVPVRNEERNLSNCLARLDGFAEVFVVDSNSTDRTREIAIRHGATLVDFQWNGKFPKKRNWCLRNLPFRTEWVLFLDADECVSDALKSELRATLFGTAYNGFWISYDNWFAGRLLRHGDCMRKLSLMRLGAGEYEHIDEDHWSLLDMEVHEHPVIGGRVSSLRKHIEHRDFKGLDAYIARHNDYSTWEAKRYLSLRRQVDWKPTRRQRIKYKLLNTWFAGPLYFFGSYLLKGGFMDGRAGFQLALLKMFYFLLIKCKINEFLDADVQKRPLPGGDVPIINRNC
jgi:glycosyltransferase involved in cell wall biosynthesis